MSSEHEQPFTIELNGSEVEVIVCFDITSFSEPDDWATGGGSSAEICINNVYYLNDTGGNRCIADVLRGLRDHELRYYTAFPRYDYLGVTRSLPVREMYRECGFKVIGGVRNAYTGDRWGPMVIFNENRTIMDRLESDVLDWVHENESDLQSDDDYDPRDD